LLNQHVGGSKNGSEKLFFFERTNNTLEGGKSCTSSTFAVNAGLPSLLEIIDDVPDSVPAGMPFATQPKVQLMDAGGNVCSNENLLTIPVSIGHNPAGANLIPASNGFTVEWPSSSIYSSWLAKAISYAFT